jgi:hypothetical protein
MLRNADRWRNWPTWLSTITFCSGWLTGHPADRHGWTESPLSPHFTPLYLMLRMADRWPSWQTWLNWISTITSLYSALPYAQDGRQVTQLTDMAELNLHYHLTLLRFTLYSGWLTGDPADRHGWTQSPLSSQFIPRFLRSGWPTGDSADRHGWTESLLSPQLIPRGLSQQCLHQMFPQLLQGIWENLLFYAAWVRLINWLTFKPLERICPLGEYLSNPATINELAIVAQKQAFLFLN